MDKPSFQAGNLERGVRDAGTGDDRNRVRRTCARIAQLMGKSVREVIDLSIAHGPDGVVFSLADECATGVLPGPLMPAVEDVGQGIGKRRVVVQQDRAICPILPFNHRFCETFLRAHTG